MTDEPLPLLDEDQEILTRFMNLSEGNGFKLAAVEVWNESDRIAVLDWLSARCPHRRFRAVSLASLGAGSLVDSLVKQLGTVRPDDVLTLLDLERVDDVSTDRPRVFLQLNVQRDLLVKSLDTTVLLLADPVCLQKLRRIAPDFCDYLSLTARARIPLPERPQPLVADAVADIGHADLTLADDTWPEALQRADRLIRVGQFAACEQVLDAFEDGADAAGWSHEATLLRASVVEHRAGPLRAMPLLATDPTHARPGTLARWISLRAMLSVELRADSANAILAEAAERVLPLNDALATAHLLTARGEFALRDGRAEEAVPYYERSAMEFDRIGRSALAAHRRLRRAVAEYQAGQTLRALDHLRELYAPEGDTLVAPSVRLRALKASTDLLRGGDARETRIDVLRAFLQNPASGALHPGERLDAMASLAVDLVEVGRQDEAQALLSNDLIPALLQTPGELIPGRVLGMFMGAMLLLHRHNEFLSFTEEVLIPSMKKSDSTMHTAFVLLLRAQVLRALRRFNEATRVVMEAIPFAKAAGDLGGELSLRTLLGRLHGDQGDDRDALRELHLALDLAIAHRQARTAASIGQETLERLAARPTAPEFAATLSQITNFLASQGAWTLLARFDPWTRLVQPRSSRQP